MFVIVGRIDLQELMPAGDRTRSPAFYTWSKQHNAKIPVGTFEAAVEGPAHDLKAFLEFGGFVANDPDTLSPLNVGDVTPEMEREWQSFLPVVNDHFRHTMDNFAHKTDYGKAFTDVPLRFEMRNDTAGNPEKHGLVRLSLIGPQDGDQFRTKFFVSDTGGSELHIEDRRSSGDKFFDQQGIDVDDRYWDSLLESGVELPTSHPAIQQRFSGIEEGGFVRREVSGSYQTYDNRPSQGGQPISGSVPWSRNQGGDYTQQGQSLSGEQATATDFGLPGDFPVTTEGSTAVPLAEALTAPVSPADVRWEDTLNDGATRPVDTRPVDTRPVGEAILGQGNTMYIEGVGAVEIGPDGSPQLNATQTSMALKHYLRSKIGDHPGIDQFADVFLGSETTSPRGTPPRTLRDWAIQQQLDNILINRGLLDRETLERTATVSTGGLAPLPGGTPGSLQDVPQLDTQLTSSLNILNSMGELGNLALPDVGIDDLNLPEVGVPDLGLPGVGVGDLDLPDLSGLSFADLGGVAPDLSGLSFADMGGVAPDLSGLSFADMGGVAPDLSGLSFADLGGVRPDLSRLSFADLGGIAPDLSGLTFADMGGVAPDLSGLSYSDLGGVAPSLSASDIDISGLLSGLRSGIGNTQYLLDQLRIPSLSGLTTGISGLERDLGALNIPDLSGLSFADLGGIAPDLSGLTFADMGGVAPDLSGLSFADMGGVAPDLGGVNSLINVLEQRLNTLNIPSLEALTTGIGDLSTAVGGLDIPSLMGLSRGISGLESRIGDIAVPSLAGLTSGLSDVERRLNTLNIPQLQPLLDAISGAESRIGALDVPSLGPLANALSDISTYTQGLGPTLQALSGQLSDLEVPSLGPLSSAISDWTTAIQNIGVPDFSGLTPADLGLSLPSWSGLTPADLGLDLSMFTPDGVGGDIYNEYITNVTGGGAGFDPVAFGQGLAGAGPEGYDYLNLGLTDFFKHAMATPWWRQGMSGLGGGGLSPDALRTGLGQFFFGSGWDQLAPTIDPERGLWDDMLSFCPGADLTAFTDWGNQFRTGLGLAPGQTMQDLISGLIPAQPALDPAFTNPNLFFEGLTNALVDAYGATAPTFDDGTTAPTSWYSGTGGAAGTTPPTKPPVHEIPLPPALEMPAIPDFREYLQYPLMEGLTGALGDTVDFGVNPYDVRRDAILEGPTSAINEQFDEARENLINRFGTMGMMGSPAFSEQMRKLERDRAQQTSNIASQFGLAAAAADEPIRRGRLQDLAGGLRGERDFVRDELKFQTDLDALQKGQYDQFITSQIANWMAPLNYDDEGNAWHWVALAAM